MKIGIMGGTFDPIHNGHINMGLKALSALELDKVLFIPTGFPYCKVNDHPVTLGLHRYNMVWNSIKDYPGFEASNMEIKRPGRTYTADTLEELKNIYPEDEFYFILGADSLNGFENWYKPEVICNLSKLIVFSRQSQINDESFNSTVIRIKEKFSAEIHTVSWDGFDSSSTEIRNKLSIRDWSVPVPSPALAYIKLEALYKPDLTIEEIVRRINTELNPHRFNHSLGVAVTAFDLATVNGTDPDKAYLAGLLHDVGKPYGGALEHAEIGAEIANNQYGINDEEILQAIRRHTVGAEDMSPLDEVLYVSDLIEPSRDRIENLDEIRKLSITNFKGAVALCAEATINYLNAQGKSIDDTTIKVYNKYKSYL